ncbi:MAG: hypothetical protein NTX16_02630 [Actinobacteria bacterium]|nr:hypothetical protein [Actinomycetota bacterium]
MSGAGTAAAEVAGAACIAAAAAFTEAGVRGCLEGAVAVGTGRGVIVLSRPAAAGSTVTGRRDRDLVLPRGAAPVEGGLACDTIGIKGAVGSPSRDADTPAERCGAGPPLSGSAAAAAAVCGSAGLRRRRPPREPRLPRPLPAWPAAAGSLPDCLPADTRPPVFGSGGFADG